MAQYQSVLTRIKPQLEYDSLFADKIKHRNVVLGYYFSNSERGAGKSISGVLPEAGFSRRNFQGTSDLFHALGQLWRKSAGIAKQCGIRGAL